MEKTKKQITVFVIKISIKALLILSTILGIILTVFGGGGFMSATTFLYFTTQSNIWVATIIAVFLVLDIIEFCTGESYKRNWLYIIKFMFTVAISLTFVVFALILSPFMGIGYLLSMQNLTLHFITPILAIIDFILFDTQFVHNKKTVLYATIMPIYYFIFSMILSVCGNFFYDFDGSRTNVPYFFLNYNKFGWFTFGNGGMGVAYWFIIQVGLVVGMAFLLLFLNSVMQKRAKVYEENNLS